MMKKRNYLLGALLGLCLLGALPFGSQAAELSREDPVRAVTYAGREWVINFWSTETEYMEEDFARIREDGFNAIILCVPWREFQPSVLISAFNEDAFAKLRTVCETAERQGLSVMLRLGYSWDYYDHSNVLERFEGLIYDDTYLEAWKRYAKQVYETVSAYDCYAGAFLTWEDFWNFVETEKNIAGTASGSRRAKEMGYTDYVLEHYSQEELQALYGDAKEALNPSFPEPESPAYRLFLEWYDSWLLELLSETQQIFPALSMECRLDQDPYVQLDGSKNGYNHQATFPCAGAPYCSVMLSASMGYGEGTVLNAVDTAKMSESLLAASQTYAGKPVFVDQFLYMETTPGYEKIARLPETEVNAYLTQMGEVFRRQTLGYGIWTYRDYADNIIYNPEFGYSLEGWETLGRVDTVTHEGTRMAKLSAGASLSQDLSGRTYLGEENTRISLRAVAERPVRLTITVGDHTETAVAEAGDTTLELSFPKQLGGRIRIKADGEVLLDNVKLYTHVTEGGIYGLSGEAGPYLEGIRALNRNLAGS